MKTFLIYLFVMAILIAVLLFMSGCGSIPLPPPPQGDTCIVDVQNQGAECVPISSSIKHQTLKRDDATSFVQFNDMDNYVCFSPLTWRNIQIYIGDLKDILIYTCKSESSPSK